MNLDQAIGVFGVRFLSCLRGSERLNPEQARGNHFLSCLRGSELTSWAKAGVQSFLSCLRGSERFRCR